MIKFNLQKVLDIKLHKEKNAAELFPLNKTENRKLKTTSDRAYLVFPHQLYEDIALLDKEISIYLIEEFLFFKQYNFNKQKIAYHRATCRFYESYLLKNKFQVVYVNSYDKISDVRNLIPYLKSKFVRQVTFSELSDYWLEKRITKACYENEIKISQHKSQLFILQKEVAVDYLKSSKKYFQTDFYIWQRKSNNILIDEKGKPAGGKWSYDTDNRLKYPKNKNAPAIIFPEKNNFYKEAITYTEKYFADNTGNINNQIYYPSTFHEAKQWLDNFLQTRFYEFGLYEDAIVSHQNFLHHSVLTPMMNVGLLSPGYIVERTLEFGIDNSIPLNSIEGFVRQIIGWREFIRGVYETDSVKQRSTNFWKFTKTIPASFYNGTTGIAPVDDCIKKLLNTGYTHHIERLMILGNFMLLCEFHPNEVYRWFMEMYVDAYDWVMVPNVYGMSQFADGGLMCTKPYISGSNYIFKMSDYKKGEAWAEVWDGLFWRFMHVHRKFFLQNPRLGMLISSFDKMEKSKKKKLLDTADQYLQSLLPANSDK